MYDRVWHDILHQGCREHCLHICAMSSFAVVNQKQENDKRQQQWDKIDEMAARNKAARNK